MLMRMRSLLFGRAVWATGPGGLSRLSLATVWLGAILLTLVQCRAEFQFDVFVGYGSSGGSDGIVREAGWFPVACEVYNDGPSFDAVFEFSSKQLGGGQTRRMAIELPTGTRKRFSFPMFAGSSRYASWTARLRDSKGKVRAERADLGTKDVAWESYIMGGLPRSFGGLPSFPPGKGVRPEMQAQVARMTVEQFPDNPIGLEGLNALYISSEKALALQASQYAALQAWVHGGGHLVVGLEQAQDVSSTPWLRALFPIEPTGSVTNRAGVNLQAWVGTGAAVRTQGEPAPWGAVPQPTPMPGPLRAGPRQQRGPGGQINPYAELNPDLDFETASFPVFVGRMRDGIAVVSANQVPLIVNAPRGRGQVTALMFSPDREPFRSWKHRGWFWARLLDIPGQVFDANMPNLYGGWSLDGVFGAMVETRQVRKLPVEWLLALLVVYLLVIGPVDQWWLKKINRQMLTWVTFPAYVVLFSLLIYYIGYKLRAGETEWNELSLVDILPRNERAELRGRTFASLYSSANAKYKLGSDQPYATMRPEFAGMWGGEQDPGRTEVLMRANSFQAEVSVPVWTSLLFVNDWEQASQAILSASINASGGQLSLSVTNRLPRRLSDVRLAYQGRLYDFGELEANKSKTTTLRLGSGLVLGEVVRTVSTRFTPAMSSRRRAFGGDVRNRIEPSADNAIAASFISQCGLFQGPQRGFIYPPGIDLSPLLARGDAVLLAWDAGHSVASSAFRRFEPRRSSQNTLLRLAIPAGKPSG